MAAIPAPPFRRPISATRAVPVCAGTARALLAADPGALLGVDGSGDGARLLVGIVVRHHRLQRAVKVGIGPVVEEDDGAMVLPLWWEAAEHPRMFPTFDGGLEVGETETGTLLRLEGSYQPPLGRAGAFADGVAGSRAARATLDTFLEDVAVRLAGRPAVTTEPGSV